MGKVAGPTGNGAPCILGQSMAEDTNLFEMRRLEALSNTIFGVAMTLLAYDIPKGQISLASPDWTAIWHAYASHLVALLLSFIVAGIFWLSHQRRLAYAPHAGRPVVILNLVFLLSIILLPATTGLYGTYWDVRDIVILYGAHLMLISALNGALWVFAVAPRGDWAMLAGPAFSTFVFVIALIVGAVAPTAPRFVWPFAFVGIFLTSLVERKQN
ncbi:MAG: potassium channel family protein [Methylobacteriaceae bacterium]|nr:potassium channel family protein [Methylobacteriaceae bacterium]